MKKDVKALTFEQARELLPDEFCPNVTLIGRKKLLQTPKGIMAFRCSSLLDCGEWKTSYNEDSIRNDIDFLMYAVGYEGILILSREVLLSFVDQNYKGRWADNGYPIHVYKEAGKYIWHGIDGNTKDLTEYFFPNK